MQVSGVSVDSTDIEPGWVFVAVPGFVRHGVRFAGAAVRAGAVAVVTDEDGAARAGSLGVPIAVVPDPRAAAGPLAAAVYGHPARELTTMTVTGTNGKTTTSFFMRAALAAACGDASLYGTVEARVGSLRIRTSRTTAEAPVVERLLALTRERGIGGAVVEASAHAISLHRLDGIVFDVAAFTNLQHDHLDFYHTMDRYFEAKKTLFAPEHARRGVVCVDDRWGRRLAAEARIPVQTVAALSDQQADWRATDIRHERQGARTVFTLHAPDGRRIEAASPVLGTVNVQNVCVAVAAAHAAGVPVDAAVRAIREQGGVPGRMERIATRPGGEPLVVVDYAHTPEALEWTLRSVRAMTPGRLVLVFGTDGDRDASKREDLAAVAARLADRLWVTDENPRSEDPQGIRDYLLRGVRRVRPDMRETTQVTTCRRDAVRRAILDAGANDTVLITGKGAETSQEVQGIRHAYTDQAVAREVLEQDPRRSA